MYEANISRKQPGCILFLLDRSDSMGQDWQTSPRKSLAEGAAEVLNKLLFDLCLRSQKEPGAPPRAYFDVGVFGYGRSATRDEEAVEPALLGPLTGRPLVSITDLAMNPLAVRQVKASEDLPPSKMPVWFDPVFGYLTPMCQAIAVAGQHVANWVGDHPGSFPPIIINITDGMVTDSPYQGADLAEWARRLCALSTQDGPALLFNVFLSSSGAKPEYFPSEGAHLPDPGPELFAISSLLPPMLAKQAEAKGFTVGPGARGMAFNAGMAALANFLDIGTRLTVSPD